MEIVISFKSLITVILISAIVGIVLWSLFFRWRHHKSVLEAANDVDDVVSKDEAASAGGATSAGTRSKAFSIATAGLTGVKDWFKRGCKSTTAAAAAAAASSTTTTPPPNTSATTQILSQLPIPLPQIDPSTYVELARMFFGGSQAAANSKPPVKGTLYPPINQETTQQQLPSSTKSISTFQSIGHTVFTELVERFGGKRENIRENVRCSDIINPETGRRLEFDSLYEDGVYRIAVEYQGAHHYQYPNSFHRSIGEYEAQCRRDEYKSTAAANVGVLLIKVPYEIDRHVRDEREPSGWRFNPKITETERKTRIREYILSELTRLNVTKFGCENIASPPLVNSVPQTIRV